MRSSIVSSPETDLVEKTAYAPFAQLVQYTITCATICVLILGCRS